jgi:citrate lyase subunit beta/citryl-CoA lyase
MLPFRPEVACPLEGITVLDLSAGHTRLVALVETADAYFCARQIAKATPRLVAMSLGAEDFALSVGMEPNAETLQAPKQTVIIAARAAGHRSVS